MKLFSAVLLLCSLSATSQKHSLTKIWETDTIINVPESVLPDDENGILYVSLVEGQPWSADGKGGVAKLTQEGKLIDSTFISGLNAPKGLGKWKNNLYVADISDVVVIDLNKGKIEKKIAIPGASGLNDITVSDKGDVFVSDSHTGRIWKITNSKPLVYLENVQGANGVKSIGDKLIYAQGKDLKMADAKKNISHIASVTEGIDGIEPVGNGDFLVTSWVGYIYYVHANGQVETLLETHDEKINAADIGFDRARKILYVPTFFHKTVAAYHLK